MLLKLFSWLPIVLVASACTHQQDFDATQWKLARGEDLITDVRESMITDLLASDTLSKLSRGGVIDLLGEPDIDEPLQLDYVVREKYSYDIDPEYVAFLVLTLDSTQRVKAYFTEQR